MIGRDGSQPVHGLPVKVLQVSPISWLVGAGCWHHTRSCQNIPHKQLPF